jgi:AcrR family transcriptional regulator
MTKNTKRESIIQAAGEQFKQYGYRKTSMDDISQRLGISRASLYSYFENKDEIFRSVSLSIHERALTRAQNHLFDESNGNTPALVLRVENALLARHSPFQKAVTDSPHGNELFDDYSRLCGDIVLDSHARFQALLASALNAAAKNAEVDLKQAGTTGNAAAEVLNLGAAGLKHGAPDLTTFKKRLKSFTRIFIAGLRR